MENDIKNFIKETFMYEEDIANNVSLLDTGVMDSTGAIELVLFLEEAYDITVGDDEITPENLDSIDNIIGYVNAKI